MKFNFIKTDNPLVAAKLRAGGFVLVSEQNGVATFANDPSKPMQFEAGTDFVYTNKLEI